MSSILNNMSNITLKVDKSKKSNRNSKAKNQVVNFGDYISSINNPLNSSLPQAVNISSLEQTAEISSLEPTVTVSNETVNVLSLEQAVKVSSLEPTVDVLSLEQTVKVSSLEPTVTVSNETVNVLSLEQTVKVSSLEPNVDILSLEQTKQKKPKLTPLQYANKLAKKERIKVEQDRVKAEQDRVEAEKIQEEETRARNIAQHKYDEEYTVAFIETTEKLAIERAQAVFDTVYEKTLAKIRGLNKKVYNESSETVKNLLIEDVDNKNLLIEDDDNEDLLIENDDNEDLLIEDNSNKDESNETSARLSTLSKPMLKEVSLMTSVIDEATASLFTPVFKSNKFYDKLKEKHLKNTVTDVMRLFTFDINRRLVNISLDNPRPVYIKVENVHKVLYSDAKCTITVLDILQNESFGTEIYKQISRILSNGSMLFVQTFYEPEKNEDSVRIKFSLNKFKTKSRSTHVEKVV